MLMQNQGNAALITPYYPLLCATTSHTKTRQSDDELGEYDMLLKAWLQAMVTYPFVRHCPPLFCLKKHDVYYN